MLTTALVKTDDLSEIEDLIDRARQSCDGWALSEHKAAELHDSVDRVAMVTRHGDRIVGYVQAAWHEGTSQLSPFGHWGIEMVLDPDRSPRRLAIVLLDSLRAHLPDGEAVGVWANELLAGVLSKEGMAIERTLLRLSAPLPLGRVSALPEHMRLEAFRQGRDDDSWLTLNNEAFLGHPENGRLTRADLSRRAAEEWFDPAGFLLAWEGEDLAGFCWTKRHDQRSGEIYIIGVDPTRQGSGLGGALLTAGADHLRSKGAHRVFLYVEGNNHAALQLYRTHGFRTESESYQLVPEG